VRCGRVLPAPDAPVGTSDHRLKTCVSRAE
jgi:hypothetical protein